MKQSANHDAFIDSQNLNLGVLGLGWKLDFRKFRIYLEEKYKVTKAYLFLGYLPEEQGLYNALQSYGYVLVFKPVLRKRSGGVKGNVDAELVLQAMIDYPHYDKAVIVTGDGDFACLVKYLHQQHKLHRLIVPNRYPYFILLSLAPGTACTGGNYISE
ncbi:NYN domain-containing protein [Candidatus Poribacteria bacterium]|nr:NYN domain-containing protein [Candidatus Poribacteria bacterium]